MIIITDHGEVNTHNLGLLFTCITACPNNTFGFNCSRDCGSCLDAAICDSSNGTCAAGCAPGYQGILCQDGNAHEIHILYKHVNG